MNCEIAITKATGGEFLLVAFADIILECVTPEFSADLQVVKYFRGAQVEVIDRGQVQTRWDFTFVKEWPTLEAALAWHNDVRTLCPRVGTTRKTERGYKGVVTRFLENAGIGVKSLPRIGVTTFTQVTILGGIPLTARP